MLRRTTILAVPAATALVAALTIPSLHATADTAAAEECVQAGNVWVHVEYDDTVTGDCATEFATALDALESTSLTEDTEFVQTVDGRLAEGKEWWSVYSLSPTEDGSYPAEWDFATVGVAELELSPASVLALQLQEDWEADSVPPATNPVEGVTVSAPEATETPDTSPSPSPEPTADEPTDAAPADGEAPGAPKAGY